MVNSAMRSPWTLSCLPSSTTKTQDSWRKGDTAQERHTRLPSITQPEKKYSKAAAVWVPRRQHSSFPRPTPSEKKIGSRNLYLSNPEPVRMPRQARKPEEEKGRSRFCAPVTDSLAELRGAHGQTAPACPACPRALGPAHKERLCPRPPVGPGQGQRRCKGRKWRTVIKEPQISASALVCCLLPPPLPSRPPVDQALPSNWRFAATPLVPRVAPGRPRVPARPPQPLRTPGRPFSRGCRSEVGPKVARSPSAAALRPRGPCARTSPQRAPHRARRLPPPLKPTRRPPNAPDVFSDGPLGARWGPEHTPSHGDRKFARRQRGPGGCPPLRERRPDRARARPLTSAPASTRTAPTAAAHPSPRPPLASRPAAHSAPAATASQAPAPAPAPAPALASAALPGPALPRRGRFCRQRLAHRPRRTRCARPIGCRAPSPAPQLLRRPIGPWESGGGTPPSAQKGPPLGVIGGFPCQSKGE